jgi:hypothetical protein
MILNSPYITGSLTVTGDATIAGNITVTGSLSGTAATSSFALTLQGTGSVGFATTGAFSATSGSASSRLTQIEQVYATTGSNSFRATQSITGSLTVTGQIIAQSLNVQQVTSSIVYSSGSNTFGCDINSRQTFTGSFYQTGSTVVFGTNCAIFGIVPADFSFNVGTSCVGTNASIAQFYNSDYTTGTRGFIRVRNNANVGATTSAFIGQGQDSKTYIYNNDPSRPGDIVITGTGLVGIGTCNPTNQLTIAASNSTTAGNICTALTLAGIRLFPISGTTNGLSIGIAGANINYLQAQYSGDCAPAPLSLQPYGGNMGIGTIDIVSTCLSGSLTIRKSYQGDTSNGSTTQNYYVNQSALYLFGRNSGLSIIGNNGEEGEIIFGNNSTRAYARIATGTGTTSTGGDMYFKVGGDTERMRITTAGNLLVGGTTAGTGNSIALRGDNQGASGYAYLQVSGCGSATEGIYLYNSSGLAGSIGTNGACTLIFSTFTTERMRISGNCIGINNSNPRASLEINQACSDQNNGGFMFRTLDLPDNTWTSFFTPPANWGGVTTLNWVGTNDFNRSGAAQIRWAYSTATAQLGPVAVFFCDSQNAQPCWRYSGGDLQIYVSGAGAGKRLQAMIMGSRGA